MNPLRDSILMKFTTFRPLRVIMLYNDAKFDCFSSINNDKAIHNLPRWVIFSQLFDDRWRLSYQRDPKKLVSEITARTSCTVVPSLVEIERRTLASREKVLWGFSLCYRQDCAPGFTCRRCDTLHRSSSGVGSNLQVGVQCRCPVLDRPL